MERSTLVDQDKDSAGAVVFLDVQQNENSWKYHGAGVPCASASCLDLREIHQKKARTKLMVLNAVLL